MTAEEAIAYFESRKTNSQRLTDLCNLAEEELKKSDKVAIRCWKAGVAYPPNWNARDVELRTLMTLTEYTPSLSIPSALEYPEGS